MDIKSAFYHTHQETYEIQTSYVELPMTTVLSHPYFSAHPFPSYLQSPPLNLFPQLNLVTTHATLTRSIMFQALNALAYLHGQTPPIAHRDINPANILLTHKGLLKLVDFGIVWDPGLQPFSIAGENGIEFDDWKEDPEDMCGQVATGYVTCFYLVFEVLSNSLDPIGLPS